MKIPTHLLDRAEFQNWRDNPVTVEFLGFLRDRQQALMVAWGRGLSLTPEEQAQAVLLGQLADLSFEMIAEEYRGDEAPVEEAEE